MVNHNIVIQDYDSQLISDRYDHKTIESIKNLKLVKDLEVNIISLIYNVDESIIHKYYEIYGEYPSILNMLNKLNERDHQRLLNIVRSLKLNKIINNTKGNINKIK